MLAGKIKRCNQRGKQRCAAIERQCTHTREQGCNSAVRKCSHELNLLFVLKNKRGPGGKKFGDDIQKKNKTSYESTWDEEEQ